MLEAATDAIGTLKEGNFDKIRLGLMTVVTMMCGASGDEDEDPLFVSTLVLVKQHGLNYRHNGEPAHANSGRKG